MAAIQSLRKHFRPLRRSFHAFQTQLARAALTRRWTAGEAGRPHRLPSRLIVSLTSYPPRFATLSLTLKCLLSQTITPDRVVLWIAHEDMPLLPPDVRNLAGFELHIAACENFRSYKKLLPALRRYPDAFIATADDDVYYGPRWLERLVEGYHPMRREIPCGRAHRIRFDGVDTPAPYARWKRNVGAGAASPRTFPVGVGGVLYPPRSLDPLTEAHALCLRLAPSSDDAWFYWMARRAGWTFRKVGPHRGLAYWPGTQEQGLQHENAAGGNDVQILRLSRFLGPAWAEHYEDSIPAHDLHLHARRPVQLHEASA